MNYQYYVIQIPRYSEQWEPKMRNVESWLPSSIAGTLAIMCITAIIATMIKR